MAVGFPAKTDFADGGYLTATQLNDVTGTLNLKQYSGETLLSTTAVTLSTSMSVTGISQSYSHLRVVLDNLATVSTGVTIKMTLNSNTGAVYSTTFIDASAGVVSVLSATAAVLTPTYTTSANTNKISGSFFIPRYASTSNYKNVDFEIAGLHSFGGSAGCSKGNVMTTDTSAVTSIQFAPSSGNFTAQGNIYVYGVA